MGDMIKKRKVLLMPSYWPSKNAPIVGSQVYEQTTLLAGDFEYKVLYCLPGLGWKRFLWYTVVKLLTGKQLYKRCTGELLNGSLDVYGVYYLRLDIMPHRINRWLEFNAYRFLVKKIIKLDWTPDLIHARTAEYAGVNAAKLSRAYNLPYLLTENCIFILGELSSVHKVTEYRYSLESADTVAVVSSWLKNQILINKFKCSPVVIGNWIDENHFTPGPTEKSRFTILNIGHTGFTKSWPIFFKAIHYLVHELNIENIAVKIAVTHVYDQASRDYIPDLISQFKLDRYCEVLYQVPRNKIAALYQLSSVFVSSSINETFGIATAEAMFCGVPVIATDNGGINDFLSADSGIKVNVEDYVTIATVLRDMYEGKIRFDPAEVRKSVMEKFGTDAFKKRITSVYHQTITNHRENQRN